jgi:hypothetical protein
MYRQRLESILAVDEGVAAIVRALQDSGELSRTPLRLHVRQRLLPRRAPDSEREGAALRALRHESRSSCAAPVCRVACGPRSRRSTSTLRRRSSTRPTPRWGGPTDGVSLLALLADRTRSSAADVLLETPTYAAIHTPRYVYVEHNTGERELYDLKTDPDELASLHENAAYGADPKRPRAEAARASGVQGGGCRKGPALSVSSRCVGKKHRAALAGTDARHVTRVDWIYRGGGREPTSSGRSR